MKTKKKQIDESIVKAFKKANREIGFERNGGGHFVAITRPHKNKKKYNRGDNKKELSNQNDSSFFIYSLGVGCCGGDVGGLRQIDVTLSTPNKAIAPNIIVSANIGAGCSVIAQ